MPLTHTATTVYHEPTKAKKKGQSAEINRDRIHHRGKDSPSFICKYIYEYKNYSFTLRTSDRTNLCHSDASESSLQQLLPPGVQAMEFFHHGCRDKSTVKGRHLQVQVCWYSQVGVMSHCLIGCDESRLFLAMSVWNISILNHETAQLKCFFPPILLVNKDQQYNSTNEVTYCPDYGL